MNKLAIPARNWRESLLRTWLPIGLFSILWLDLCRLLSANWAAREQYAYGWFVPFFIIYLLWRRWVDRFQMRTAGISEMKENGSEGPEFESFRSHRPVGRVLIVGLILLAALSLLPMRVIYEVNRDWPFISWPYTIVVVLLTLCALELAGQQNPKPRPATSEHALRRLVSVVSPSTRHFGFPICLILLAVVWPGLIEKALIQSLMQLVTSITVEIVGWLGVPAVQHGNVIALSVGTVGIDEACSGVRSFHSSLMISVVMGELYRLRALPRISLVLIGAALALLFNVVRTTWLTLQTAKEGLESLAKWHDPAGWTTTVGCVCALWMIAVIIKKRTTAGQSKGMESRAGSNDQSSPASSNQHIPRSLVLRMPRFYLMVVGAWMVVVLGLTEAWYRSHEKTDVAFLHWSVSLPDTTPAFHTVDLPQRTRDLLGYDTGISARWQEADGSDWTIYFFQWQGKTSESIMRARSHRPEVCLPAAGLKQASDAQFDYFDAAPLKLPFRYASYSAEGEMLYVYYCLWQDGDEFRKGMRTKGRADRLAGPLEGKRRFGQQVLEIVTTGYPSAAEAERAVRQRLLNLIRIEGHSGPALSAAGH